MTLGAECSGQRRGLEGGAGLFPEEALECRVATRAGRLQRSLGASWKSRGAGSLGDGARGDAKNWWWVRGSGAWEADAQGGLWTPECGLWLEIQSHNVKKTADVPTTEKGGTHPSTHSTTHPPTCGSTRPSIYPPTLGVTSGRQGSTLKEGGRSEGTGG